MRIKQAASLSRTHKPPKQQRTIRMFVWRLHTFKRNADRSTAVACCCCCDGADAAVNAELMLRATRVPPRGAAASPSRCCQQHLEERRDDETTSWELGCSATATELLLRRSRCCDGVAAASLRRSCAADLGSVALILRVASETRRAEWWDQHSFSPVLIMIMHYDSIQGSWPRCRCIF